MKAMFSIKASFRYIAPSASRRYATVSPTIVNIKHVVPPPPPSQSLARSSSRLENCIFQSLLQRVNSSHISLVDLIEQYQSNAGRILETSLLYESRPDSERRIKADSDDGIVLVANCVKDEQTGQSAITVSSGFQLEVRSPSRTESVIVTCAHTLEEIRKSPLLNNSSKVHSGTFVVVGTESPTCYPVKSIASALPRSDVLLLTCDKLPVRSLPVSPYPVHKHSPIQVHLMHEEPYSTPRAWRGWKRGQVEGYRDFAGRLTEPGTYDPLSHMLFSPLPTAGSSGGPIVDEESGAVVGVILGKQMDNRIEGSRGWGIPSETIFEMFSLPGLEGKK